MNTIHAPLPLRYRLFNVLGRALVAVNRPETRLDPVYLCRQAMAQTRLTDFGDPYFREGLVTLLAAAERDARLTPIGRIALNQTVSNMLTQRLKFVAAFKEQPQLLIQPLLPPLLITGPARSGTTYLHNMLAIDAVHRALPYWLLVRPFPVGNGEDQGPDPRRQLAQESLDFWQGLFADLDTKHYMRVDLPEECIMVLALTFNSLLFGTLFPVIGYMEWYLQHMDSLPKYQEYRWLLQYFQSLEPEQRLTLKAPAHMSNLEAITHYLPEVMIVQTHRDPVVCVSSTCSLISSYHRAVAQEVNMSQFSDIVLRVFATWFRRNLAFRQAHPGVIYDVDYNELVADPLETVRGIYDHFGLPWTEAYVRALRTYIAQNPKDKHGRHRYAPEDYGLTAAKITGRLGFYNEQLEWEHIPAAAV
jgi:hypothetical protein